MADWMAVQKSLPTELEVIRIATALGINRWEALGKVFGVWRWFDTHTTNGVATDVSAEFFDDEVQHPGFAQAMADVGWLKLTKTAVSVPKFDRWMGSCGKKRLQRNRTVAAQRGRKRAQDGAHDGAHGSAPRAARNGAPHNTTTHNKYYTPKRVDEVDNYEP